MKLGSKPVKITSFMNGPFVIVVSVPDDEDFPIVVSPPGGFEKAQDALDYIEINFSKRKEPYLGCDFTIAPMRTPFSFIQFCSWED